MNGQYPNIYTKDTEKCQNTWNIVNCTDNCTVKCTVNCTVNCTVKCIVNCTVNCTVIYIYISISLTEHITVQHKLCTLPTPLQGPLKVVQRVSIQDISDTSEVHATTFDRTITKTFSYLAGITYQNKSKILIWSLYLSCNFTDQCKKANKMFANIHHLKFTSNFVCKALDLCLFLDVKCLTVAAGTTTRLQQGSNTNKEQSVIVL